MTDYTRLLGRLDPKPDGESPVRHRTGVVDAVNTDGTLDIDLGGVVVPGVATMHAAPVGAVVQVLAWKGDLLALGAAGGAGVLGYAETTSDVGGISTTAVNLALTPALNLPPNRRIKLTGAWWASASTVSGDRINFRLASGSVWMQQLHRFTSSVAEEGGTITASILTGAGGSSAFAIQAQRFSGTGTLSVSASATAPISITVEDIGPS